MKIAFISTMAGHSWGGSEELWAKTARLAIEQGHEVLISVFDWGALPTKIHDLQTKGAHVHLRQRKLPLLSQRFYKRWLKRIEKKFIKQDPVMDQFGMLYQFVPEIICISQGHTFEAFLEQRKLVQFINQYKFPYILISQFGFEHGTLSYQLIEPIREFFGIARQVFFVSQRNRLVAERQLVKKLTNVHIISNPVNLSDYSIVPYPSSISLAFACVARLECNFKGQDILFEVLSNDIWQSREWVLNLYGEGPDRQYLEDLAVYFNIKNKVNICGHVTDIRSIWAQNNMLILPSIGEGTPLSLVEAMICGRPAVVTDVGGNAEMVIDGKTGFISDAASVLALNNTLERAWQKRDEWQIMGEKAHAEANKRVNPKPEETIMNVIGSYHSVV
jgi:glycosyltransferase involved in cell wall biosynthesis